MQELVYYVSKINRWVSVCNYANQLAPRSPVNSVKSNYKFNFDKNKFAKQIRTAFIYISMRLNLLNNIIIFYTCPILKNKILCNNLLIYLQLCLQEEGN